MEVWLPASPPRDQEAGIHSRLMVEVEHGLGVVRDVQPFERALEQSMGVGRTRADPADVAVPPGADDGEMARRPSPGERQELADDCRVHGNRPGSSCSRQRAEHWCAGFYVTEHAFKLVE